MSAMNDFHHQAMDLVGTAILERVHGNPEKVSRLYAEALELELAAIAELTEPIEPTHSVLHRSAGWMAYHSGQYRKAERLAAVALSQEPPPEIADELRDLLKHLYAQWPSKRKAEAVAD